jgi:hypothetical protein
MLIVSLEQVREAHNLFCEGLASGEVKSLPFRLFGADHVENAFRFLSTGVPALLFVSRLQNKCWGQYITSVEDLLLHDVANKTDSCKTPGEVHV